MKIPPIYSYSALVTPEIKMEVVQNGFVDCLQSPLRTNDV
jgi:hypothetical protein